MNKYVSLLFVKVNYLICIILTMWVGVVFPQYAQALLFEMEGVEFTRNGSQTSDQRKLANSTCNSIMRANYPDATSPWNNPLYSYSKATFNGPDYTVYTCVVTDGCPEGELRWIGWRGLGGCRIPEEVPDCANSGGAWNEHSQSCFFPPSEEAPLAAENNNGDNDNNTCNPISISSGNKYFQERDYISARAQPLKFFRSYNSNSSMHAWMSDYQQHLRFTENIVEAKRPDGAVILFSRDGALDSFLQSSTELISPSQRIEKLVLNSGVYKLTLADNTIESYNTSGRLLSIQYTSGIVHDLSYSNNNNRITVSRFNKRLVLDMVNGNVVKATLPGGSEISYTWDTSGTIDNLTQVTYADGSTKTYLYENTNFPHYVTGILDENDNRISSVEYDSQGRAISSEVGTQNSGVERTQIQYHTDGTRTVTNSLGKQNTYHFTQFNGEYKMTQVEGHASANCAAANQNYTYDANGFMASKTDWEGNVTTYVHNDRGLETSRTEASGTPQARTITTEWHPTFNLRTKITEPERETVFAYDDQGRLTSQEVNPR